MTKALDDFSLRYYNLGHDDIVRRVDVLADAVRDLLSENASLRREIDDLSYRIREIEIDHEPPPRGDS